MIAIAIFNIRQKFNLEFGMLSFVQLRGLRYVKHLKNARLFSEFRLEAPFLKSYEKITPPFGFNGLGELVYIRTYSRNINGGLKETWQQTVERVVNGTYQMQIDWFAKTQLSYDASALQIEAQEMYDRIFHMKFLPPGRGLWAMGTPLTKERKLFAALNNCAFVSTADLAKDPSKPFCFLMDASMLGVGVGFDTRGAGSVIVRSVSSSPSAASGVPVHVVEDSREGWVESLRILLTAYLDPDIPQYSNRTNANSNVMPQFDYSQIRSAGALIKGFGGVSQGPQILKDLHQSISQLLETRANQPISVTSIVDIMNLIGKCVVSGNIRRTAEIAFGDPESEEYISLKDYTVNPERASYGWTSNNSVFATLGMNYSRICENVRANGEPGFAWLENMQAYGRMSEPKNFRDYRARGGNPCLEQTLESFELCCLVEVFPMKHDTEEDFLRSVQLAMTYAKTVTLGSTHWPESNAVMLRNRRIGTSLSGIAQFIAAKGMGVLKDWCEAGYETVQQQDRLLSERFAIPRSVKTTCIKPSGTVSLLAGSTPGMHYPESRYYMRRIRMAKSSDQIPILSAAGYHIEPAEGDVERTVVVSIPVDVGEGVRTLDDVTMWEQLALAAFLQAHWADNQVSCTVTFDPMTEASQLSQALDLYQYQLKGVSFLPRLQLGAYPQMPYESITKDEYEEQYARLKPLNISTGKVMAGHDEVPDKFCDAAGCAIETTERVKEL